jgi:hypothetical protein
MKPALSGPSDAIEQRVAPVVSHVKEPVLAGSVSISGIPEPGVVALLGFGLLLLGFAYGRAGVRFNRPLHWRRKGGSHLKQSSAGRSSPQVGDM